MKKAIFIVSVLFFLAGCKKEKIEPVEEPNTQTEQSNLPLKIELTCDTSDEKQTFNYTYNKDKSINSEFVTISKNSKIDTLFSTNYIYENSKPVSIKVKFKDKARFSDDLNYIPYSSSINLSFQYQGNKLMTYITEYEDKTKITYSYHYKNDTCDFIKSNFGDSISLRSDEAVNRTFNTTKNLIVEFFTKRKYQNQEYFTKDNTHIYALYKDGSAFDFWKDNLGYATFNTSFYEKTPSIPEEIFNSLNLNNLYRQIDPTSEFVLEFMPQKLPKSKNNIILDYVQDEIQQELKVDFEYHLNENGNFANILRKGKIKNKDYVSTYKFFY